MFSFVDSILLKCYTYIKFSKVVNFVKQFLKTLAKFFWFMLGEIFILFVAIVILNVSTVGMGWGALGVAFIFLIIYAIVRGIASALIFKNLRDGVFIFSAISATNVFIVVMRASDISTSVEWSIRTFLFSFVISLITWGIYESHRLEKAKSTEEANALRHPYITTDEDTLRFQSARTKIDDADDDRAIEYAYFKDATCKSIGEQMGLDFRSACLTECNRSLERLANEGVYYLMQFISLGALSKECLQKVDFIAAELIHIQATGHLPLLKGRINDESYAQMEQDLQEALAFYNSVD